MAKFRIKLKNAHDASDVTAYRVSRDTGISHTTVMRYTTEDVEIDAIHRVVVTLADYYGVDWRSPEITEVLDPEKVNITPEAA